MAKKKFRTNNGVFFTASIWEKDTIFYAAKKLFGLLTIYEL